MEIKTLLILFLCIVYILLVIRTIYRIIINYNNSNPVKTIGWILAILLFPVIGMILYIVIGRNLKKKRSLYKRYQDKIKAEGKRSFRFEETEDSELMEKYTKLNTLLDNLSQLPVFRGNKIDLYSSGKEKFRQLFADIEAARDHIHVFYYTIGDDETGINFRAALIKKAKEGVTVRLMYDAIGCNETHRKYFEEMTAAGIQVTVFSPVKFSKILRTINYRNHNKIVVIDGEIGYTGGMNVKDDYVKGLSWGNWQDLHLRIQGSGAQGLQAVFFRDWYYTCKEFINEERYFPKIRNFGNNSLQIVTAEPTDEYANIMRGMICAIMRAKKSVYIETPYFVPTASFLSALQIASLSGVEIYLVMPHRSDNQKVQYASNSYVAQLLTANVSVFQYNNGFIHSKLMVVDNALTIAGSSNLDIRSFDLNFETNVFVYDKETAVKAREIICRDIHNCHKLTLDEWMKRSKKDKFIDSLYRLFSPLL
ncbi:MAG: cardiolipin synthase [Candidatus Azobacteroides sp.]|nr:cardiolipin synthase [Candidatus Azobacteroides sp.]